MREFLILMMATLCSTFACAQGVQSGTLQYNGANYPCDKIEFNLPPAETQQLIQDMMKSKGYNPEKGKNYLVYRNVNLPESADGEANDLIIKVERKDRKQPGVSVVSLITARHGEVPAEKVKGGGKTLASVTTSTAAGSFLRSFQPQVDNQAHNLLVLAKSDEIRKAEKKLADLKKEQAKLEKKIQELQGDLQTNIKDQDGQSAKIVNLKKQLEVLKLNSPES